jgi:hypothetical protein
VDSTDQTPLTPLQLLVGARRATILLATALLSLAYLPLRRVLTPPAGLLALLFVGWSPLGLALSQRLHPDGLMSLSLFSGWCPLPGLALRWPPPARSAPLCRRHCAGRADQDPSHSPGADAAALTAIEWLRSDHRFPGQLWLAGCSCGLLSGRPSFSPCGQRCGRSPSTLGQVLPGMGVHAEGHSNPNFFWGEIREDLAGSFYPVALWFRTTPASAIGLALALGLMAIPNSSSCAGARSDRRSWLCFFCAAVCAGHLPRRQKVRPLSAARTAGRRPGRGCRWFALAQLASQRLPLPTLRVSVPAFRPHCWLSRRPWLFCTGAPALYHAPYYFTYFNPLACWHRGCTKNVGGRVGRRASDQAGLWPNEYDQGQGRTASAAYLARFSLPIFTNTRSLYFPTTPRPGLAGKRLRRHLSQPKTTPPARPSPPRFFAAQTPVYTYSFRG